MGTTMFLLLCARFHATDPKMDGWAQSLHIRKFTVHRHNRFAFSSNSLLSTSLNDTGLTQSIIPLKYGAYFEKSLFLSS